MEDGRALGRVLGGLVVVDADDVARAADLHRLGAVLPRLAALVQRQRHEGRLVGQHELAHPLVRALAHPEDVLELARFQAGDGLGADHPPVGHDADPADGKARAQALDDRHQRRDVRRVARPGLRADRPALAVEHHRDDHLVEVRPVILAVAAPAQPLPAGALEVEAGGVHEHHVQGREQIPPMGEQRLLDQVLDAARARRRLVLAGQRLAQPRHGPIEMVQPQGFTARDRVVRAPLVRRPVRARDHEPVQHRQEHRPLEREAELPFLRLCLDHRAAAGLAPQPLEDQPRPEAPAAEHRRRAPRLGREHQRLAAEPRRRSRQALQIAARLDLLAPAEIADDVLARAPVLVDALDEIDVGVLADALVAEKHGDLPPIASAIRPEMQQK